MCRVCSLQMMSMPALASGWALEKQMAHVGAESLLCVVCKRPLQHRHPRGGGSGSLTPVMLPASQRFLPRSHRPCQRPGPRQCRCLHRRQCQCLLQGQSRVLRPDPSWKLHPPPNLPPCSRCRPPCRSQVRLSDSSEQFAEVCCTANAGKPCAMSAPYTGSFEAY